MFRNSSLVTVILAAVGSSTLLSEAPVHAQAAPDHKSVIQFYLRAKVGQKLPVYESPAGGPGTFFGNPKRFGHIELSPPIRVQHPLAGWSWMTCFRSLPPGQKPSDYAVFIVDSAVVDVRRSVVTDNCENRAYEPLR